MFVERGVVENPCPSLSATYIYYRSPGSDKIRWLSVHRYQTTVLIDIQSSMYVQYYNHLGLGW